MGIINIRNALFFYIHTFQGQIFFFSNLFHFAAMTSVVWNPLLYFWLAKYFTSPPQK